MKFQFSSVYEHVAYPLLLGALRLAALGHPKIREGLFMRKPINGKAPWLSGSPGLRPVWIHCASGEFEYAKPVIREIKRRDPKQTVLVTYFSPSVRKAVETFPGVDIAVPAPWDQVREITEFIKYHEPRALLIARTDTWPVMLECARKLGVPSLLFSATLAKSAGRNTWLARPLTSWVFSNLSEVFCVSKDDEARFRDLGVRAPIRVAGDTRFDQVLERLKEPIKLMNLETLTPTVPTLVAGSTWPQDEARLIPTIARVRGRLRVIIAPHEPTAENLLALEQRLKSAGLNYQRFSQAKTWPQGIDVLVVDQVGILAELYLKAELAFVGGSFKRSVHSVMEALAAGCLTFVGPKHGNNREALEFANLKIEIDKKTRGKLPWENEGKEPLTCVMPVENTQDWIEKLETVLQSDIAKGQERAFIREQVRARTGKSKDVADWFFANRLS